VEFKPTSVPVQQHLRCDAHLQAAFLSSYAQQLEDRGNIRKTHTARWSAASNVVPKPGSRVFASLSTFVQLSKPKIPSFGQCLILIVRSPRFGFHEFSPRMTPPPVTIKLPSIRAVRNCFPSPHTTRCICTHTVTAKLSQCFCLLSYVHSYGHR
jgi:hypothetical protein